MDFDFLRSPLLTGEPAPEPDAEETKPSGYLAGTIERMRANPVLAPDAHGLAKSILAKGVLEDRSFEDTAADLKRLGMGSPETLKSTFELNKARRKFKDAEESDVSYGLNRLLPGYGAGQTIRADKAMKRMREGKADQKDYELIAQHERMQEIEKARPTEEAVKDEITKIPLMIGEFATGANALKALKLPGLLGRAGMAGNMARAGTATPLIPSTYLKHGAENQLANPSESLFQSYAPAVALAASQNAVLGQLQGLLSGQPITRAGRILGKTGVGMVESAGADVAATSLDRVTKAITGKTLGLDTKWGLLGSVLREDEGSKKAAIVQFATFSVFSAMHSGREIPHDVMAKAIETAKPEEIADVGKVVQEAAAAGQADLEAVRARFEADKTPLGDLGRAYVDAVRTDPLIAMGDEGPIPQRQRPGDGRKRLPGLFDRPPEVPSPDAKQEPQAGERVEMAISEAPAQPSEGGNVEQRGTGESESAARGEIAQPLRISPGQSPAELAMTRRVQDQEAGIRRRLEQEQEKRKFAIADTRRKNLDKARLKLATGTVAGDNWTAREAQAKVDGVRTFGSEIRGRLDPESLSRDEMQILGEMAGIKNPRRLPIFAEPGKGRDLDQLAQEMALPDGQALLDRVLGNVPVEMHDKATARLEAEHIAEEMAKEQARLAELPPEQRAAEQQAAKEAALKRYTEPFDWEDVGDAREQPSKIWKFADDLEQQARAEIEEKLGRGEVPFMGFDPTLIPPMAKLLAAKLLKGGITFAEYSAGMVKRFGDSVKPHLKTIWEQAAAVNAGRSRLVDRVRAKQGGLTLIEGGTLGEKRGGPTEYEAEQASNAGQPISLAAELTAAINQKATWLDVKQRERLLRYLFEGSFMRAGESMNLSHEMVRKSATAAFEKLKSDVEEFSAYTSLEDLQNALAKDVMLQRMERIAAGEATEADVKAIGGETNMEVMKKLSRLKIQQLREEREYDKAVDDLMKVLGKGKSIPTDLRARLKLEAPDGPREGNAPPAGEAARRPEADRERGLFDLGAPKAEDAVPPVTDAAATEGAAAEAPPAEAVTNAQPLRNLKTTLFDFLAGESGHYWFPTAQVFKDMTRAIFGRGRGNDPDFKPDTDQNPDNPRAMQTWRVIRRAAANQLGANNATPAAIATTAWAWGRHTANNNGNAWLVRIGNRFAKAFEGMADYADKIEEEIRNPGSQHFNAEQNAALDLWMGVWEKKLRELDDAGIKFFDEDGNRRSVEQMLRDGYFHRGVVDQRADSEKSLFDVPAGTAKPGFKPGYKKRRAFETAEEGAAAGVEYMGFIDSIADFIRSADREIVDKGVADDPLLGGVDLEPKLRARYLAENKDVLDKLPKTEREALEGQLIKLAHQHAQGNVRIAPAFKSKLYPAESKAQLEATFGERAGPIVKRIAGVNQEIRNLTLGADASYTFLQLLGMAFTNPILWGRTIAKIPRALVDGKMLNTIGQKRPGWFDAIDLITQSGGTINQPMEGTIARGQSAVGNFLNRRLPFMGRLYDNVYGRASQAMSQILDVAKVELFMANRPADPKELPRFVEALEHSLGQGRMEKLGMSPERALIERVALLAPSFYRAHVGLLRQALQGGAPGRLARKQLGGLAAGVLATTIAALYALKSTGEISDEEMEERLNPGRGKFLMVPVPLAGGKKLEVGFGGIYVSIARTLGNAQRYAEGQTDENPAARWYRGHAGSLVRTGWDLGTGEDYLGRSVGLGETALKSVMPVAAQQGVLGEGDALQRIGGVATGALGLRSYSGNDSTENMDRIRRAAQAKYGKRYEDLGYAEQASLVRQFAPEKEPAGPAAIKRAMANDQLRAQRLRNSISGQTRDVLEEFKVAVPSYDATLSIGGTPVPLTRSRQEHYEKLLAEEYDRSVATWPLDRLREAPTKARTAFIQRSFEAAKHRAKSRLVRS